MRMTSTIAASLLALGAAMTATGAMAQNSNWADRLFKPVTKYLPPGPTDGEYQSQAILMDEPANRPHRVAMTDEYGNKYDHKGNRLDARGYPMR